MRALCLQDSEVMSRISQDSEEVEYIVVVQNERRGTALLLW